MKHPHIALLSLCLSSALLLSSCSEEGKKMSDPSRNQEASDVSIVPIADVAIAVVHPTKGNKASGKVTFTKMPDGVKVVADIDGLTPGKHGFHIHEKGDCSAADASSAGGHFNPTHMPHGGPDSPKRHVGDLGNIEADAAGHAHFERVDNVIQLDGPNSVIGRAVIVHADADDFVSQPAGNAGARVGCGVIQPLRP